MFKQSSISSLAVVLAVLSGLLGVAGSACAWYPRLAKEALVSPGQGGVVGSKRSYVVGHDETLMEIARRGHLGFNALSNANPGQDPWLPQVGSQIVLPYEGLVPASFKPGITVNLAEFRLYLVEPQGDAYRVRIYPIGLGRDGWQSPEGHYQIGDMVEDPIWTRPETMRDPSLPATIEAGPDNPLGRYWLGLSLPGYGIHGTNRPFGIGRRVSHGCIRLYAADIADLAQRVERGTPVAIVYQPVKVAIAEGQLVVEVHPDYLGRVGDLQRELVRRVAEVGLHWTPDAATLQQVAREAQGLPVVIAPAGAGEHQSLANQGHP